VFPAGVFEFIGSRDAQLGEYQACSLFSPMFDFADQQTACDTALAALQALFEPGVRQDLNPPHPPAAGSAVGAPQAPAAICDPAQAPAATGVSKRDFLFGTRKRGSP
jgi:[NiFe] hydrogenase assembly HybE family chaperone